MTNVDLNAAVVHETDHRVDFASPRPMVGDFPAMQMVRTSRTVRVIAKLTFIILAISIVAMFFVPWRQTARGVGTVVALDPQERSQAVLSPAKGVISYVADDLREGSYVRKDEVLLRLSPFAAGGVSQVDKQIENYDSQIALADDLIANALKNEEEQIESGERIIAAALQDVEASRQKYEQAKAEIGVYLSELREKENKFRIMSDLFPKGLKSQQEFIAAEQDLEGAVNKLLRAEGKKEEAYSLLSAKEESIESKKKEVSIKNRDAKQKVNSEETKKQKLLKERGDLLNKADEFDRLKVKAPRSGYIQQWLGLEGSDTVKEGDQLFTIVPDATELAVEMKVTGNDMPLIHEGDRVRLQFEGWPAVQFVGWPSVAIGTFGGKVNRVFPTDDGKGNFRVVVTADNHFEREDGWPDDRYLRQGVRANGWVLLKRVPLGYEIWRQLNGFPPVVADEAPDVPRGKKPSKPKLPK